MTTLTGLHVPLITPFDAGGAADLSTLEELARGILDGGAAGLVALGTTGEPGSLTAAERAGVTATLSRVCRERGAHLTVGAGDTDALRALDGTADAALVLVPPFVRPGEDGVVAYLGALAEVAPVPVIVYHVPYRTGQSLSATALRRIAALPGIAGIKIATGGLDEATMDLLADPPADFAVLCGDDLYASPLLALGAHGAIMASAHVATSVYAELIEAWQAGDVARARKLGNRLAPLSAALFAEPNPTVVKGVLHRQGRLPSAAVRLPLVPASGSAVTRALAASAS